MLTSLHGSPQQPRGWDAFPPSNHTLSFPYDYDHMQLSEPVMQWQPNGHVKRSNDSTRPEGWKPDKKKGASRMQVKREAQKAMLARSKSNNAANASYTMPPVAFSPLGFISNPLGEVTVQCDSLKRKYDQALSPLEQHGSSKRSLMEPSWPIELTGFEDEQSVWRLRGGGGPGGPDEHSEEPSAEGLPQKVSDGEGSNQAGQRVDALISEVASMMESAQRGAQPSEYLLRLNRLESIPSLPRFNSLELADEMFADILKWDLPKGEGRPVEMADGEVIRTKGGGPQDDDAQAEEFLKSLDPSLANQEPGAIQDQLQLGEGNEKGGASVVRMQGGAKEDQETGSQEGAAKAEGQNGDDSEKTQDDVPGDQEVQGLGEQGFEKPVEESREGESAAALVSDASKPAEVEDRPAKQVSSSPPSPKPMIRSPKVEDNGAKHRHFARPSIDILAQASASLGPTSPVASKDSLESPESPIVSSLVGGAPRRPKFTPLQHEKLRALAGKAHWNWGAIEGTSEARQLCADLSIDAKQLKRWVDSHRPKEVHQQPHPGVPFMGWGVPPPGMTNPAYMSYMPVNPMGYPAGWGGMPRPPPGDGPWAQGGPGVPPMGPPFHPPMQVPYGPPMMGPGFGPPPYAPGGATFIPGGPGAALVAAADVTPDLDENQELVASAEALGKLLGDRVNTIPPEKLKEILAAWMAHKRNKREMEKASQLQQPTVVPSGGVKRKELEPVATPPQDEPSEGSLLQFSIPSLERGLSNAPSISTLLGEELAAAAAEEGGVQKEADHPTAPVSPGAFKGQGGSRDSSLSVLLRDISGGVEHPQRMMGPLERQVFGVDEDNMQMGPAAESGDDESASSSDEPGRPSRRRPGLRPRSKRRRVAESSGGEEEEEPEEPQSEENEPPGGGMDEEEFPREHAGTGGQWQLATGLEDRRMPPPLGYQGHVGQTTVSSILFEKNLTASDTSHLGRWVLPKLAAERYMPYMEHRDGTFMLVEDSRGGRWCCKYRWWPNNKSKMYVLEQTGDIVKHLKLHPGDAIHFCQSIEGHLMIFEQKKGSKQRPPVPLAASPAPLPKRYAKRIPIEPKSSPKGARKNPKTPKGPRSPVAPAGGPFRAASYKLSGPFARISTRGRTIRPSSRLRKGAVANLENGPPTLVYNASAGQDLVGQLVPFDGRGAAMLPPGGPGNKAVDPSEVGIDPWAGDELLSRGEPTAHINELARRFLSPDGSGRGTPPGGVPRPLARTGSADLANEILALTSSSREMGPRDLSPLGAPSRQGSLTPVLQRTKSQESLPFSVTNFPPIPTGLESLSRSSSLNRTASLARAGSLLSRLPSDLEALSKMDNFPSFDFTTTPPLPVESAFQPYGATPGRGTLAGAPESAQNRRRAG